MTEKFADPEFDGDPVQIYEPRGLDDSLVPPEETEEESADEAYPATGEGENLFEVSEGDDEAAGVRRYVVDNVEVRVAAERVQYFDADGRLITESLKDYTRNRLTAEYASLNDFLSRWNQADRKQAILEELAEEGILLEALAAEVGRDFDPFDLICHVVWDMPPLTRRERADEVKKQNYFTKYEAQARRVLEALLEKYADEGVAQIEKPQILNVSPFTEMGTPMEIAWAFGGRTAYLTALQELTQALYSA